MNFLIPMWTVLLLRDLRKITFLCLAVLQVVHLTCFDSTTMVAAKDAAVTQPEKSQVLAPRLRNKKRARKTTTEVPNIAAQELDLDERLDQLESGIRELRRFLLIMIDKVKSLKAEISQLRIRWEMPGDILAPEPSPSESASSCITTDLSPRSYADSSSASSDLGEASS